jgi:NAD(P)H-hydrate epimerase
MTDFFLSREQVRELDRRAIEEFGVPGIVLMENAGRGCAELLMRLNPERLPTVILCGPGNNGGDGFVIARHLDNVKWPVFAWVAGARDRIAGDALVNYLAADKCRAGLIQVQAMKDGGGFARVFTEVWGTNTSCWMVDAMFGTGLARPLDAGYAELVGIVNASGQPVLAIDIPSGLDCDTGEPLGPTIRATHTATFVAPKLGFQNPNAKQYTGEVHVVDIGAPRVLVEQYHRSRSEPEA